MSTPVTNSTTSSPISTNPAQQPKVVNTVSKTNMVYRQKVHYTTYYQDGQKFAVGIKNPVIYQ